MLYRAWDINLDIAVAIVENPDSADPDPARLAAVLTPLNHSHLPRLMDYVAKPEQSQYLVFELIEGESLQDMLDRQGVLSVSEGLEWVSQICQAVDYWHKQSDKLPYLNYEPAYITIQPEGELVLIGFDPLRQYHPAAGKIVAGYSAPEEYDQRAVDSRSDVYSLGAILYHCLTGQIPPESIHLRNNEASLTPPRQLNQEISPAVEGTILKAMALEPEFRFQSLAELQRQLLNLKFRLGEASEEPVESLPAARSRFGIIWLGAGLLLGIIITALFFTLFSSRGKPPVFTPTFTAIVAVEEPGDPPPAPTDTPVPPTVEPAASPTTVPAAASSPETAPSPTPAPTLSPTPVTILNDPLTGAPLILVPAGSFTMGGPGISADAQPAHTVTLSEFYIDKYEVTNANYAACVAVGACQPPANAASYTRDNYYDNPEYEDYPVVQVSWEQASAYCAWRGGRLPTEAEWEKAARGSDTRLYPWGEAEPTCEVVNYWSTTEGACVGDTTAVGSYPAGASPYEVLDLSGNVWEWVFDWYEATYYVNSPAENPRGPETGVNKVLRGGSWVSNEANIQAAFRNNLEPTSTSSNIGFRCVVSQ